MTIESANRRLQDQFSELGEALRGSSGSATEEALQTLKRAFRLGGLSDETALGILASNPEFLLRGIAQLRDKANKTPAGGRFTLNHDGQEIPRFLRRRAESGTTYEAAFIIHALNPLNNDSVAIAASIGAFLRTCAGLGVSLPKARAYLTGKTWAALNKAARRTRNKHDLEDNLERNLAGRTLLFKLVGLPVEVFELERPAGTQSANVRSLDAMEIRDRVNRAASVLQMFRPKLLGMKIEEAELQIIEQAFFGGVLQTSKYKGSEDKYRHDVTIGAVRLYEVFPELQERFAGLFASEFEIIKNIARYRRFLSREYFEYFLIQLEAQREAVRGGYLKYAPSSEEDFDTPFAKIDKRNGAIDALYMPHYRLAGKRILPYSTDHIDFAGYNNRDIRARIVSIRECAERRKDEQTERKILANPLGDNIRLLADLVGFYVYSAKSNSMNRDNAVELQLAAINPWVGQLLEVEISNGAKYKDWLRGMLAAEGSRQERALPLHFALHAWSVKEYRAGPSGGASTLEHEIAKGIRTIGRWLHNRTHL
ncbi:MAG: hypothetical protein HYS27_09700 [Deltaproteobacteria bacterium]|nr:hypothetical protein [Deltaproteobacteria bacterium]